MPSDKRDPHALSHFPTRWNLDEEDDKGAAGLMPIPESSWTSVPDKFRQALVVASDYFESHKGWNLFLCLFPLTGSACLAASSPAFKPENAGTPSAIISSFIANGGIFFTFVLALCFRRMIKARDIVRSKPWVKYLLYQALTVWLWMSYVNCLLVQAELTGGNPPDWIKPYLGDATSPFFYTAGGTGFALTRLHAVANIIIWLDGSERKSKSRTLIDWISLALTLLFISTNMITWVEMYAPKFLHVCNNKLIALPGYLNNKEFGAAATIINPLTFYFTAENALIHLINFLAYSTDYLGRLGYSVYAKILQIAVEIVVMGFVGFCSTSGLVSAASREDAPYITTLINFLFVNITSMPKAALERRKNRAQNSTPNITSALLHSKSSASIQDATPSQAASSPSYFSSIYSFVRSCCGSRPAPAPTTAPLAYISSGHYYSQLPHNGA